MKKISIIIPVYNVANYLEECLNSIVNQTIGLENLEVVMIDDGSTDASFNIMEIYASKYDNFKVIRLESSSGAAGKPRNEGLKIATAPYIMFIDPDDVYDLNACKILYDTITSNDADIVTANYKSMDENGRIWEKPVFSQDRFKDFSFNKANFRNSYFIWNSAVWNKIFSRELIVKNNIEFLEGVPGEDAYFSYAALLNSNKLYYISDVVYHYRRRNNDGTLSISWDRSINYFKKINFVYKKIYELFADAKKLSLYRYFYAKTLTSVFYKIIDTKKMTDDEKALVLKEMQWFFKARKRLKMDPCQKSLNLILEKVDSGNFDEAVGICNVISEMRTYIASEIRENMAKPENINYMEVI